MCRSLLSSSPSSSPVFEQKDDAAAADPALTRGKEEEEEAEAEGVCKDAELAGAGAGMKNRFSILVKKKEQGLRKMKKERKERKDRKPKPRAYEAVNWQICSPRFSSLLCFFRRFFRKREKERKRGGSFEVSLPPSYSE